MSNEQKSRIWCSFCSQRGHNRRGCEQLKQAAKTGNIRAQKDVALWKESDERRAKTPRKCSYCTETGHNRRSCKLLKGDHENALKLNKMFCNKMLESMSELGLGVGTLIRHDRGQHMKPIMGLVSGIDWSGINLMAFEGGDDYYKRELKITPLGASQRDHSITQFPVVFDSLNEKIQRGILECRHGIPVRYIEKGQHSHIVGRISKESVMAQPPEAWKEGKMGLEYVFTERPSRWGRTKKEKPLTRAYVSAWVKVD